MTLSCPRSMSFNYTNFHARKTHWLGGISQLPNNLIAIYSVNLHLGLPQVR
jgi:hypothetical protein